MRALKNRARADCEVHLASVAAIEAGTLAGGNLFGLGALRAGSAVRPQPRFEQLARCLLVRDGFHQLVRGDGALAHVHSVLKSLAFVKQKMTGLIYLLCYAFLM